LSLRRGEKNEGRKRKEEKKRRVLVSKLQATSKDPIFY